MNPRDPSFLRLAGRTALASAVVSVVGIIFLIGMASAFAIGSTATGQVLGQVNDICVLVQFALLVPTVLALRGLCPTRPAVIGTALAAAALVGIAWVVLWQALLIVGAITFEQQIGIVTAGFVPTMVWFVVTGHLATEAGVVRRGVLLGVGAALYVGFPFWAVAIGRGLSAAADGRTIERSAVATAGS
jgi:hypothetical protein